MPRLRCCFSQLVYWTRYGADVEVNSGWVFKSRQEFELELGLTRAEQESARATLVRMGSDCRRPGLVHLHGTVTGLCPRCWGPGWRS